ncbi:MAG: 2-amino-4-hydroxy-6-hydroxymethyldihydropteridine diphosphokinase [Lachnospiraceae bacterium]|nr:2-amino-4-hydroxy-6-hydroxymethyldihydropteridine diphosphokinase [Lachnospiraceae bacterium]
MDEIRIDNLEVFAHHGVFPQEKEQGQYFYVNAVLYTDLHLAGKRDDLNLSTHYGDVSLFIEKKLTEHTYDLIEAAAEKTAEALLLHYPLVRELDFELRKPHAPIPMQFDSVSVKLHRGWHQVFIAFGSNRGDRKGYIDTAIAALKADIHNRVEKVSAILETKPYGGVEQEDFLNGVLKMDTLYTPHELLNRLHELEQEAGRERTTRWGPRTLDLDILFYDKLVYEDKDLILPHVDLQNRNFVLKPMVELAPWFRHPLLHKTMEELLTLLEEKGR